MYVCISLYTSGSEALPLPFLGGLLMRACFSNALLCSPNYENFIMWDQGVSE